MKKKIIQFLKSGRLYFFLVATALLILIFHNNLPRFFISVKSFWHHFVYFVSYDFLADKTPPLQSLNYVIDEHLFELLLPVDWDVFKERFLLSFHLLINKDLFLVFLSNLGNFLYQISRFGIFFLLFALILFLLFKTQKFNAKSLPEDSKGLRLYKRFLKLISPAKATIKRFFKYVLDSIFIRVFLIIALLFITNLLPIVIDTISELLLICSGGHFEKFFPYLAMALMDFLRFFIANPIIIVIPTTLWIFDRIRIRNGLRILKKHDDSNKEFYDKTGNIILITGASGTGKTTMLVDAVLTLETSIRNDKLLKILHRQASKFPNFNWRKLESEIDGLAASGQLKTRVDIMQYVNSLYLNFKKNGSLFNYEGPLQSWDNLTVDSIFKSIQNYSIAYFFYRIEKPLSIAATGIYHDLGLEDKKHWFPLYNPDYFTESIDDFLKRKKDYFATIIDYNAMRLGTKKAIYDEKGQAIQPDPYLYNIGVIAMPECDKERGSYADIRSQNEDEDYCNQVNDLFYIYQTIMRHNTELDHEVLHKIVMDDQDLMKLNSDMRQLVETVITLDRGQRKAGNALLLWWIDETICSAIIKAFHYINDTRKQFKRNDTLFTYFVRNLVNKVDMYYTRRFNQFGFDKLGIYCSNSSLDDVSQESEKDALYLSYKKLYSGRFDDVYLKSLFLSIEKNSSLSIEDFQRFESVTPTVANFSSENSFLYDNYFSVFGSGKRR